METSKLRSEIISFLENREKFAYICGIVCLLIYCISHIFLPFLRRKNAEKIISEKLRLVRKYKDNLKRLSKERSQFQLEDDQRIVELHILDLLSALRKGTLSAKKVLRAYQFKALEADEKTNCVTEFITDAEARAEELDQDVGLKQPLHGLPISVKDNICVKGYDCTLGLVKFLGKPVEEDACIVEVLKNAGAIPFVKTNVPQTLLSFNCCNPIFGVTSNPVSSSRTPGGSGGGEGALIALGGSIIGLGTDIGGSLRIPAHMCGIFCLKPTHNRLSGKNIMKAMDGITGVLAAPGPMSKTVDGLVLTMQTWLSQKMFSLDPEVIPIPFNDKLFLATSPLRIGYYECDGVITPTPGCTRAVREAKEILEAMGHELIRFDVPRPKDAYHLAAALLLADGGQRLKERW